MAIQASDLLTIYRPTDASNRKIRIDGLGGAQSLNDLSDVDTSAASEGDILMYVSSEWTTVDTLDGGTY